MKRYSVSTEDRHSLANRFCYHSPIGDQAERYGEIRSKALEFALFLSERCPVSRELSTALTKLDECMMAANASIARNESAGSFTITAKAGEGIVP